VGSVATGSLVARVGNITASHWEDPLGGVARGSLVARVVHVTAFHLQDPLGGGASAGQAIGGFGASAPAAGTASPGDFEVVDIGPVNDSAHDEKAPPKKGKFSKKAEAKKTEKNGTGEAKQREASLQERERELARREAELQRQGQSIDPMRVNNWPPCYPILHHDILHDIPKGKRGVTCLCVSYPCELLLARARMIVIASKILYLPDECAMWGRGQLV
jgi:hypothetical protein